MQDSPAEEFPVYLRVVEEPVKQRKKSDWKDTRRPNDNLTLVLDTETATDTQQELRFGIAQLYSNGRLSRTFVFTGKLTPSERATLSTWAEARKGSVSTVEEFVAREFLPLAVDRRAVVVGFNLPFDLSRIAADSEPKVKVRNQPAWKLLLIPRSNPKCAYVPRIRIEHVNSAMSFISFTGTKGKFRNFRGAFVDGRTFVRALTGESHTLESAGEAFDCVRKKTTQDYRGPVTRKFLDYCLNDVELTAELYGRCRHRYRVFGLATHPSRVYSSATLAKAIWEARGIVPPKLPPRLTGRLMAAFYAGKVECRVRAREVEDVSVLDFTSQYPSLYCLLGGERFLTAERISVRTSTEEVRSWVESMTAEQLLRPETWRDPRMWSLCEVESDGAVLPVRSTFGASETAAPTIGWNHVTTEPGLSLPYMVADVLAAKLLGSKLPKIVHATTFEPVGSQVVKPVRVLGVEVGPAQGLIQTLTEARIREKRDQEKGWKHRADGLKTITNAGSYGIFVEVNRKPQGGQVRVYGLGENWFESLEEEVEEPGPAYCPLVGAALTSASHLLLALVDADVARLGGRVVYCDTDSAFVSPSRIADAVASALSTLNPYSLATPFLKDDTEKKAPREEYPKGTHDRAPRFFGLSAKRYCLFVRDRNGRPHVFRTGKEMGASDHGLGSFQTGENRKEWLAVLWERIIEKGVDAADDYTGVPATSQFSLTVPNLLPRVRGLGDIRPFTFLTARLLEPAAGPVGMRSELIAFVSPKDGAAYSALMSLPHQRSWGSVVEAFVDHHDWKYGFDRDGAMIRRRVMVRKNRVKGLGKEANRIEVGRVLGQSAVGGRAKTYSDVEGRVLAMGRAEARKLGIPWATVMRWKRGLKSGKALTDGHGGLARTRLSTLLRVDSVPQAGRNLFGPPIRPPPSAREGTDLTDKKVRWKVGANELEVEGDSDFVDAQLSKFFGILEKESLQTDSELAPVQLRPSPITAESSARQARDLSPAEYIRQKAPDSGTAQLVVLAKYLEDSRAITEFGKKEINNLAREAKLKDVHSQYFTYAVKQGFLRSAGKGKYAITLSGEDLVVQLPKGSKPGA